MTRVSADVIFLSSEPFTGQIVFKRVSSAPVFVSALVFPGAVRYPVHDGVLIPIDLLPGVYEVSLVRRFEIHRVGEIEVAGEAMNLSQALSLDGAPVAHEGDGVYVLDGVVHLGDGTYKVGKV